MDYYDYSSIFPFPFLSHHAYEPKEWENIQESELSTDEGVVFNEGKNK
jgi:hypothetical protein